MALEHAVEEPLHRLVVADVHRLGLGRGSQLPEIGDDGARAARGGARSRSPSPPAAPARAPSRARARCPRPRRRRPARRAARAERSATLGCRHRRCRLYGLPCAGDEGPCRHQAARPSRWPAGREGATVAVEPLRCGRVSCPRDHVRALRRTSPPRAFLGLGTPRSRWWERAGPGLPRPPSDAGRSSSTPAFTPRSPRRRPRTSGATVARFAQPDARAGRGPARAAARARDRPEGDRPRRHDPPAPRPQLGDVGVRRRRLRRLRAGMGRGDHGATTVLHGYRHEPLRLRLRLPDAELRPERISSYASFGRTFDLFGDASVRLACDPGHSAGHQSVICRLARPRPGDRRRRDLHGRPARRRPRAAAAARPPQLAPLAARSCACSRDRTRRR